MSVGEGGHSKCHGDVLSKRQIWPCFDILAAVPRELSEWKLPGAIIPVFLYYIKLQDGIG